MTLTKTEVVLGDGTEELAEAPIDAIDRTALAKTRESFEGALKALADVPCEPGEQEAWWAKMLDEVCLELNRLECERLELKAPITAAGKGVDIAYSQTRRPGLELKELCKSKLAGPARARLEAQNDARRALEEAVASGDSEALGEALAALPETTNVTGISSRYPWKFKVVDRAAVPNMFLCVDEKFVKASLDSAVKATGNPPVIPGIEFEQDVTVQRTGKARKSA